VARFLDSGAMGIIFPHCNTKQDAKAAVSAVKYPPEGERGMGGRSLSLSAMPTADYIKEANKETLVIVMIEDVVALNNLPEILAVDGLDILWVGRLDFSVSSGVPGKVNDRRLAKQWAWVPSMLMSQIASGTSDNKVLSFLP
jgi:4-hydroxy-2-oxoheptanedioate aldolase